MATEPTTTNPLDFPRYVRSLRPSLPESLPSYVDDELEKVSEALTTLEEASNNYADAKVEEERRVRVTEDEALAARIVTVETEFDAANSDTLARISTEEIARATADEAIASRVSAAEAEFRAADTETNARVTVEELARAAADEAIAARIETVSAELTNTTQNLQATVTSEYFARVNGDSALASDITTVSTTVAGHTSTLTTYGTSISGLQAKYGVKLDVNGYVSGFEQNNGSGTSDFIITADKFKIVMPGTPGATPVVPFEVSAGTVKINGNLVVDGTITSTQIADGGVSTDNMDLSAITKVSAFSNSQFVPTPSGASPIYMTTGTDYTVCTGTFTKERSESRLRIVCDATIWSSNDLAVQLFVRLRPSGGSWRQLVSNTVYPSAYSGVGWPNGEMGTKLSDWAILVVSDDTNDSMGSATKILFVDGDAAGSYEIEWIARKTVVGIYEGDHLVLPGAVMTVEEVKR